MAKFLDCLSLELAEMKNIGLQQVQFDDVLNNLQKNYGL